MSVIKVVCLVVSVLSVLFGIIVLGVIADKVKGSVGNIDFCYYETSSSNTEGCDFGIAMGVLGFLFGLGFSVLALIEVIKPDLLPQALSRVLSMARIVAAGILAFLFLVCFGVLAKKWDDQATGFVPTSNKNAAQSGIAFCFFSMVSWGVLAVLYFVQVCTSIGGASGGAAAATASAGAV